MLRFLLLALLLIAAPARAAGIPLVTTMRTPDGGIEPQAAIDSAGVNHLIYFRGDARHGDLFYVRSIDGGVKFSPAIRVNSDPARAVAIGAVRGARLAIGRNNRVHIAWNGAGGAAAPMLYTRLTDNADAFEPQRNVIASHPGIDGGGAVAADSDGHVYVIWHAPLHKSGREEDRRVWVARSDDDGKTFAAETNGGAPSTGACACCGLSASADKDRLYVVYRSASELVHRDMYLLTFDRDLHAIQTNKLSELTAGECVMSTGDIQPKLQETFAVAIESRDRVQLVYVDPLAHDTSPGVVAAAGEGRKSKHPRIATNSHGETLLVWTEGTAWNKGGSIAWQIFDAANQPIPDAHGRAGDLPVWGWVTALARPDGSFLVIY